MTDESTQHQPPMPPPRSESNGLGLAGFIVSLVGLVSCGLLSPIGLVMSFVAMFRQPKGFAIAGFVLGLLGSAWMIIIFVFVGLGVLFALIAGLVQGRGFFELMQDTFAMHEAIVQYEQDNGAYPSSINDITGLDPNTLNDRWGRPYRINYDPTTGHIEVMSDGPDGVADTDDDLEFDMDFQFN